MASIRFCVSFFIFSHFSGAFAPPSMASAWEAAEGDSIQTVEHCYFVPFQVVSIPPPLGFANFARLLGNV